MTFPHELILASASDRRRLLLAEAGYNFRVVPPGEAAESAINPGENSRDFVARASLEKAADVARRVEQGILVACDTVALCEGKILGKPRDEAHARQMLETLSGREHRVLSGLCVWRLGHGRPRVEVAETTLAMDRLSPEQIADYLASGLWRGKAGAFGYQDRLGWLSIKKGSPTNVVGLPMELLAEMLQELMRGYGSLSGSPASQDG
jgi:septum formation protein